MITYKIDKTLEHKKHLLDGLLEYNESVTGVTEYGPYCVYLLKENKLVGGIQSTYDWNWANLGEIYYESNQILAIMLNELYKRYTGNVQGISFDSHITITIDDLIKQGFNSKVILKDKPLGKEYHELVNDDMVVKAIDHDFIIITSTEPHESYKEIMKNHINYYNQQHNLIDDAEELQVIAKDDEKIVGGVYGYIKDNYLFVSILWVDESYRKSNVATELMSMIESAAVSRDIKSSWLGTTSFQAKGFYEKLGYVVKGTFEELPKGYENYTMVKQVI